MRILRYFDKTKIKVTIKQRHSGLNRLKITIY